jgi:hypothetical protein
MSAPSPGPKYSNANDRTPAILVVENEILIRLARRGRQEIEPASRAAEADGRESANQDDPDEDV